MYAGSNLVLHSLILHLHVDGRILSLMNDGTQAGNSSKGTRKL